MIVSVTRKTELKQWDSLKKKIDVKSIICSDEQRSVFLQQYRALSLNVNVPHSLTFN